jgi:hypothetical protein
MMNLYIVTFLLLGIVVGACCRRLERVQSWAGPLMSGTVLLLVFSLGAAVGANRLVLDNLGRLGAEAVLLCLGGLAGSLWLGRIVGPRLMSNNSRHDQ